MGVLPSCSLGLRNRTRQLHHQFSRLLVRTGVGLAMRCVCTLYIIGLRGLRVRVCQVLRATAIGRLADPREVARSHSLAERVGSVFTQTG